MEPGYAECGGSDTRLLRIHGNPKTESGHIYSEVLEDKGGATRH
jgi:hypothetical protein